MARKFAAAAFWVGCLHSGGAMALGLGELSLDSFLNEPLKARVDLIDTDGLQSDQIRVRLATREDFERLGVERAYFLTGITFQVIIDGNNRGQIVLTSDDPVLEPYLDFIIEARWPSGRLLREYTVLVDPPVFNEGATVVSASEAVGGPAPEAPTAPKKSRPEAAPATPAGSYASGSASNPAPGGRYLIQRDDTLWEIASAARPQGASVHQTMLDIQRLNPDAFIDGNINRIKAGYIIYLPASGDISSEDLERALDEVRQQNLDWREGRTSVPSSGPSLTVSAGPAEPSAGATPSVSSSAATAVAEAAPDGQAGSVALQGMMAEMQRERQEVASRLSALEDQLRTLQEIVTLKDEQIAALQGALAQAQGDAAAPIAAAAGEPAPAEPETASPPIAESEPGDTATPVPAVPAPQVAVSDGPGPLPGGILPWVGGAIVLLGGGLLWWRRRKQADEIEEDTDDIFADIELRQEPLEIDESEALPVASPGATAATASASQVDAGPVSRQEADDSAEADPGETQESDVNRGYGGRKHDEYASDVDIGDVLAEADIYIAYGRQQQALELLNNAVVNEPGNPRLRLKLLSLYVEAGDEAAAKDQYKHLQAIGDQPSLLEADHIMNGGPAGVTETAGGLDLDLELGDFEGPGDESLDKDFAGLEIEDEGYGFSDELDLSGDFEKAASDPDDEDLVFATEGNEMSTKLDLARAYIDMGDEEGARQILEEVATEGSADQQREAQSLLDRLG